jgi:hypothetical protein
MKLDIEGFMKRLLHWFRIKYKLWKLRREDPYIYED